MDKPGVAIRSLRTRAHDFGLRSADRLIPRYSELMHKRAAGLDEQARPRAALLYVGSELLIDFNGADR